MNKSNLLSIGEFAQLSRVTIKALHYYEKVNLLQPAWIDPYSGYRYYDASQLHLIQIIGLFTDLNIRLNYLTNELNAEYLTTDYEKLLSYSREVTKDKIEELNEKMRYIDYLEDILIRPEASAPLQNNIPLWLLPCNDSLENPNLTAALKQILHDLNRYHIAPQDHYGLIMFCNGKEKRLYYYVGIKLSSRQKNVHENIFYLPSGEYRSVEQKELNIKKIPSLFKDLFTLSYDKIVLITPTIDSYTLRCLLPAAENNE